MTLSTDNAQAPASLGTFDPSVLQSVRAFLERRGVELVLTVFGVVLAAVLVLHVVPLHYAARTDVLLDPRRDKAFGPDDVPAVSTLDTGSVESAIAEIRGNDVLLRVVRSEGLASDFRFNGTGRTAGWLSQHTGQLLGRKAVLPTTPEQYAVGTLFRALKVERIGKGYVLSITATTGEPALAARLANGVAAAFVANQRDAHLEARRREAAFFAERLSPLSDNLHRSEEALERFRRAHDLMAANIAATGSGGSLNERQLGELNTRLAQARAASAEAWARYNGARTAVAGGQGMEAIPDVLRSPLIVQLRQQQAEVARREADLAARYSDAYPTLVTVRAERREIDHAIVREMARIVANLKNTYDAAKAGEDGLKADVTLTTGAAGLDSDLGRQLRELERLRLVDQTVFETYLARAKAAEQQATFEEQEARIVSAAVAPVVPAFPKTRIVLFCALLLGIGLGTALGLLLDALTQGFSAASDVEAALRVPVLAEVDRVPPKCRRVDGHPVSLPKFLARRPQGPYAAAIHALRAELADGCGARGQVVLIASAVAGEGRTTLAMSVALSAALSGQRVLMVDADPHNLGLSRELGFENRLGLVDLLGGLVGTVETTVPLGANLSVMPAGRRLSAASDLFASRRMSLYLAHTRERFDLVVLDCPPSEAGAEAAVLARLSDRVLFVVGANRTPRTTVGRSLARLGAGGRLAGVVLNGVRRRATVSMNVRRILGRRDLLAEAEG